MITRESEIPKWAIALFLIVVLNASAVSATPGDILWKYQTGGAVYSSPVLGADGTIYVGSDDHQLHAITPDGTQKWTYATGNAIFSSPAVAADGTLYVGGQDKKLHAVNPDGSQKWTYVTGDAIKSSPAIGTDGTIYVGSADDYLHAVNPSDGTRKWRHPTSGDVDGSPAIGTDGTIYVGTLGNSLHAIKTGTSYKWLPYETGGRVFSSPAIGADGTLYVGSWDTHLYAMTAGGVLKWRFPTGSAIDASPAIGADGTLYVGSWDKILYAINPDGTEKWRYQTCDETCAASDGIFSSPAIGTGFTIYVGSTDKRVYAIRADGTLKWRSEPTGGAIYSSPALDAAGNIYVGSEDGYLYAIQGDFPWQYEGYAAPTQGYADSHWPKFGQNNLNHGRRSAFQLALPGEARSYTGDTGSLAVSLENLNSEAIRTLEMGITFDKTLIQVTEITLADGILSHGYNLEKETIDNESGTITIKIVATTETYVTNKGIIITLQYQGIAESGMGNLNFTAAKVNDLFMTTKPGTVEIVPQYYISGNVGYFGDRGPVRGVTLTLADEAGSIHDTKQTDAQGNYAFSDVPYGTYILTPSKSDDLGGLSALDASRILQSQDAEGTILLDCHQMIAADVDMDKAITENEDALKLAECSAIRDLDMGCLMNGSADNGERSWTFAAEPIETCEAWPLYSPVRTISLDSDQTGQNFTAILLGDVTGNWPEKNRESSDETPPRASDRETQPTIDLEVFQGDSLIIPLALDPGTEELGIEGMDIVIQFDEDALELDMTKTTLSSGILAGWTQVIRKKEDEGLAGIRIYGSEEVRISEKENLIFLEFDVIGPIAGTSTLSLKKFERNETTASGAFSVNESLAAEVNIITITYPVGDIDHNNAIDLWDAMLALRVLAGMRAGETIHTDVDVNNDGKLDTEDVIYILQAIANLR